MRTPARALVRTVTTLSALPLVLLLAAARPGDGGVPFGLFGPVGLVAIVLGVLGMVAGVLRQRRRARAAEEAELRVSQETTRPVLTPVDASK